MSGVQCFVFQSVLVTRPSLVETLWELGDPVYCYFSSCKLLSLINFAAINTMCIITGVCDQASYTTVDVPQSPDVMELWKGSTQA